MGILAVDVPEDMKPESQARVPSPSPRSEPCPGFQGCNIYEVDCVTVKEFLVEHLFVSSHPDRSSRSTQGKFELLVGGQRRVAPYGCR
jgi:hypothetical protein